MNSPNNVSRRVIALVLAMVLMLSVCPTGVHAQETAKSVPFVIDDTTFYMDVRFIGDTLYCPADQWAQTADCLWKFNGDQKRIYLYAHYLDSLAIFTSFDDQEYVAEGSVYWIPLLEAARHSGVFFRTVRDNAVFGCRAKPLAVFYKDMDRMFRISKYRISELINSLGGVWLIASSAARSYAILSTMSISGFVDAVSGKMDQEIYDDIFIELLNADDSLLGAFVDLGDAISRPGKVVSLFQKALDEDGALAELLRGLGFGEGEIREITWNLAQGAYGDKTLNDLADFNEIMGHTDLLTVLGMMDDMTAVIEADAQTIMAMQKVFSGSSSRQIREALSKAVSFRLGNKALAVGQYTFEYLDGVLSGIAIDKFEDACEEGLGVTSLEKLMAEALVWVYDEVLSLTDKTDAMMYAEASALIQLELADYYYEHCDDTAADTGLLMHSVALLYLRSCLASWQKFAFDDTLSGSIGNAKQTILAEISNLMEYTEEELLQNGTSDECVQALTELVRGMLTDTEATVPETTVPEITAPEATTPAVDNSYLYQDAMAAYAQLLQRGVMLATDNKEFVAASHYQLLDMDGDRLPEMVVFAVDDYVSLFHVYAYRDDSIWWIGDSLNTCEISQWYNASHNLYICDGNRLYAGVDKATAAYTGGVWGFLLYDGSDMWYKDGSLDDATIDEKLIDSSTIVGGIRIGSESDPLAKPNESEEWTEAPRDEPETESGGKFDIPYDRPADGVYYYSLADCPCLDSDAFHIYLRDSWQDYETFLNGIWQTSPMGITFQHNAGYEIYNVEFWCGIEDKVNGTFVIHTGAMDGSGMEYRYVIEEDGYISYYDSNGELGSGYGPKFCWFTHQRLEVANNCVFADERLINGSERIEMSLEAFREVLNQTDSFNGNYTEVHVTIRNGKITELVLPYIP